MAGLRQGRCAPHLKGRNGSEGRWEGAFLPREEWALAQGKKVCDPPLRLGQRGVAVPCQPKPIEEAAWGRSLQHSGEGHWQTAAHSPYQAAPTPGSLLIGSEADASASSPRRQRQRQRPQPLILYGCAAIRVAWCKTSREGRDCLFAQRLGSKRTAPIFASLFGVEGGETLELGQDTPPHNGRRLITILTTPGSAGWGFGVTAIHFPSF